MTTRRTVLIVDDDPNDIFLLVEAFRQVGFNHELLPLGDGRDAIGYLRGAPPYDNMNSFPVPDLMLLDIKMPKMTGFEVLAWLRTRPEFGALPVVMLSSSGQADDLEKAKSLGANEFKVKPSGFPELMQLVRELNATFLVGGDSVERKFPTFSHRPKST